MSRKKKRTRRLPWKQLPSPAREGTKAKDLSGVITRDPLKELPSDANIVFEPHRPRFHGADHAKVRNWEDNEGVTLAVAFQHKNGGASITRVLGSAVLVAPGIALAARHVFDDELDALKSNRQGLSVVGTASHGLVIWRVHHLTYTPHSDVLILSLILASRPPPGPLRCAMVTTRTPRLGEVLTVAGYRAARNAFHDGHWKLDLFASSGPVSDVLLQGRERRDQAFPLVEVTGHALSGMSGGPVFDESGCVIGVLSSGLEMEDRKGPYCVALLHRALCESVPTSWPVPGSSSLIGMNQRRQAFIERPDAVRSFEDSGGLHVLVENW